MSSTLIVSKTSLLFILRCLFGRHFHKSCIVLFALVALTAVTFAGPAMAEQGFALIGTWQHTDKEGVQSTSFNGDGTFFTQWDFPPGQGGTGSGRAQWHGTYRATGASAWTGQVRVFKSCASGGTCVSCPPGRGEFPGSNGCALAQHYGLAPGKASSTSWQMQGANQAVDSYGRTWRRIR